MTAAAGVAFVNCGTIILSIVSFFHLLNRRNSYLVFY